MKTRSEAEIARDTRWKLPSLERFGFNEMTLELEKISESLDDLQYFVDDGDETFMEAMDGDEDEEIEFRAMFSALEAEKEAISEMVYGYGYGSARGFVWLMNEKERKAFRGECDDDDDEGPYNACRAYDDCTVALVGRHNNLHTHGFDIYERDVFGLDDSDAERAAEAAKKRLMRMTKKDMVELIGESVSIMLRFQEFYLRYTLLTQTFEQIRGANLATLQLMKDIDAAYEDLAPELERNCRYGRHNPEYMYIHGDRPKAAERRFDELLKQLPDRFWVE